MTETQSRYLTEGWIRESFPVLEEVTYLNVGTYGIMPEPALQEFQSIQAEFERRGVASKGTFGQKTEETRQRIAAMIGAEADEIAFTRNATDGINLVLAGIDWKPGDEVITTAQEHEAMMHPLMYLHRTRGINVKLVEVSPEDGVMLARLDEVLTPQTRLVAMSLVSCESGTRLPGPAISRWAAEHGLLCLFDGAQVSGAVPIKMPALGCDFYASNGHKWLSGPKGSGFFYSRRDRLEQLSPAHVGAGSLQRVDIHNLIAEPFITGQRFEFGTRAWPIYAGLGASLNWFEKIGWERIYAHIESLSSYLKNEIAARPFLHLMTPVAYEQSSGLTSFVVEGHQAQEVSKVMREEWQIYVRVIPHYNSIRISTAHFNRTDDVDRLMQALEQITSSKQ
jgi:selenocysteine lyase/cysteine desulfurase